MLRNTQVLLKVPVSHKLLSLNLYGQHVYQTVKNFTRCKADNTQHTSVHWTIHW